MVEMVKQVFNLKALSTVDIDNEEDFILAEAVLKAKAEKKLNPNILKKIQVAERLKTQIEKKF